ncbi:MAG: polymorphic toxin-type HINT domain-containing protein [Pirellulaceae bacterium]
MCFYGLRPRRVPIVAGSKFTALKVMALSFTLHFMLQTAPCNFAFADSPDDSGNSETSEYSAVLEALEAESAGDFLLRQRLLNQASGSAEAKSYQGQMEDNGEWQGINSSIAEAQSNALLDEYEQRRSSLSDDVANHIIMARWCQDKKLWRRCRSHLARVIELEPDNAAARQALGYQLVRGEWISPEQIQELALRTEFTLESLKAFAPKVGEIRSLLAKSRMQAQETLMQIVDPNAVPCVEQLLGQGNVLEAELAVEWLGTIDSVDASQSLARFGVFHSNAAIRALAAKNLEGRSYYDYVPQLLALLESPVQMMVMPVFDNRGELQGYRQAFAKEKMDRLDYLVVDRSVARVAVRSTGPPLINGLLNWQAQAILRNRAEQNIRAGAAAESRARASRMLRDNESIQQRNERVLTLISATTEEAFDASPKALWQWWDRYNDADYQKSKPERLRQEASTVSYLTPSFNPETCECFVAGTPVVTQRGEKPIESVVAGDLVLSRDLKTGKLAWKPILRATTRNPETTVRVITDGDEITCTIGHLFWVSGKGWRKAKELGSGDILHGAQQPSVVLRVQPDLRLPTYNLEVADYGNYFVGKARVLSHDVRPRGENRETVPGRRRVQLMVAAAGQASRVGARASD